MAGLSRHGTIWQKEAIRPLPAVLPVKYFETAAPITVNTILHFRDRWRI
jgi:hypothetical protein